MEGHLEYLFPWEEYVHTSPFEEQTWAWGIDLLPIQLHCVEVANAMVLPVSSVLAYNFLKLLIPGKTLVDTFLYNSFQ